MPKNPVSTAAHVSIVALTSTIARLLAGSLSDYLAPSVPVDPPAAEPEPVPIKHEKPRLAMSRMYLLIGFAVLMCFGQIFVATGMVDERGEWFWVVSSSIGAGYGAVFTLAVRIFFLLPPHTPGSRLTFGTANNRKCRLGC